MGEDWHDGYVWTCPICAWVGQGNFSADIRHLTKCQEAELKAGRSIDRQKPGPKPVNERPQKMNKQPRKLNEAAHG
jgi:hypothetical protein